MAKFKLSEGGFSLISEGWHTFRIDEVDESKYEKFGKLEIKMTAENGQKHRERFSLTTKKGEVNEGAVKALSYFARTALNDYSVQEIDLEDMVGCFIRAEVKHVTSDTINDKTGKPYINANLGDKEPATGFPNASGDDDDEELEEL